MRNAKARAFAKALKEWDAYKEILIQKLRHKEITKSEYDRLLELKAKELDL